MGIWNTHQYAGNIVGLSVASAYSDEERLTGYTFHLPAMNIIFAGLDPQFHVSCSHRGLRWIPCVSLLGSKALTRRFEI